MTHAGAATRLHHWLRQAVRLDPSSFIRQVGETYATQIFIIALGFVNSILVTRFLGPRDAGCSPPPTPSPR